MYISNVIFMCISIQELFSKKLMETAAVSMKVYHIMYNIKIIATTIIILYMKSLETSTWY